MTAAFITSYSNSSPYHLGFQFLELLLQVISGLLAQYK